MARLIELTEHSTGKGVLVNVDLVTYVRPNHYRGGMMVSFAAEEDVTVSETIDEIAEKVKSLGVSVLRMGVADPDEDDQWIKLIGWDGNQYYDFQIRNT